MSNDTTFRGFGTLLATKAELLRSAWKDEAVGQPAAAEGKSLLNGFAADRIAELTTQALDGIDLFAVMLDALTFYRGIKDAAQSTLQNPGTSKEVGLTTPSVSAPQKLTFEVRLGNVPSAPIATVELTLELDVQFTVCRLTLSGGAITEADLGSATASAELKYKNSVVIPRRETGLIVLGKKILSKPIVIAS